ncbi:CDP-alcohol phosphatidyltransferase [Microbacterium sp. NPDC056003]|uniref:CDP-alcohol phosphatidyltransferase n=1 Tax=Microbacterium sp. NPDC056003 TaxID=3345676 RepID=UPI0035DFDABD
MTILACATLLVAPLVPGALGDEGSAALLAVPVESIAVVLVLAAVTHRLARRIVAGVYAAIVVVAVVVAGLDLAYESTIDRPFSLAEDGGSLVSAYGVVSDAMGPVGAASVVALILAVASLAGWVLAAAALRVGTLVAHDGRRGRGVVSAVAATWIVCSLAGAQLVPGAPVAASRTGEALVESSSRAVAGVREQAAFERALAADSLETPASGDLFAALAGKDVVIAFVESYGRVAVEPSGFTAPVDRVLDEGDAVLARRGYSARSAFLTSPTFGGVSWLAHATLQSGVWVDTQTKYARLMAEDRMTLSSAFADAGWRTLAVVPSNDREWYEGEAFYGFDAVLDARTLGYRGPSFGYARMPDQYTWQAFHERALSGDDAPVMAEVDLVSSHTPWTPLPKIVPWSQLGDGRVFASQPDEGESAVAVWGDPGRVRQLYAESVAYSLEATFSYLAAFDQSDLVLIVVGDHQPSRIVSGDEANSEVPVTIVAQDPAVLEHIESWGWDDGVRPSATAPVWRMDAFRDRFIDAFSP